MFVLATGLREIQKWLHNGSVLNEESPNIPGSSPASLLTSKEDDSSSIARIFRFLIILICVWGGDWTQIVSISITIGVYGVH